MKHMKLSVIVPVYNGKDVIRDCLNSLLANIEPGVEIIVVDDGSTDETFDIISKHFCFELQDNVVRYLYKQNGGVSSARNLGIKHAKGDYVSFVDADDTVSALYIHYLLLVMFDKPCIIEYGYRLVNPKRELLQDNQFIHKKFGRHSAHEVLDDVFASCNWYPFNRAIERNLIADDLFPEHIKFCEDIVAFSTIYKRARLITSINKVLYNYLINPNGATSIKNSRNDYVGGLIDHYRYIKREDNFASRALRVNLAYVIRRCAKSKESALSTVPLDIEFDLKKIRWDLRLYLKVRPLFTLYAFWGICVESLRKPNIA